MVDPRSVADATQQDLPSIANYDRRITDVHLDVMSLESEHLADAIVAAGLKLATALPEPETALAQVRSLGIHELALLLPEWASQVTRIDKTTEGGGAAGREKAEDPGYLLRQVCDELEGPLAHLHQATAARVQREVDLDGQRYLKDVQLASHRLRRLTNDLLDLASISSGEFRVSQLRFQVRDCVAAALEELRTRAHRRRSTLLVEVGPEVPGYVVGDPGRLRQVISTLVGNAVSRSDHDEIRLTLNAQIEQDRTVLLHGVIARLDGISTTGLRRKRRDSGGMVWRGDARTGLGLAVSRQLVLQMGGKTWVEGGRSGGSLLHFTVRCTLSSADSQVKFCRDLATPQRVLLVAPLSEPLLDVQKHLRALNATVTVLHAANHVQRALADDSARYDVIVLVASLTSRRGSGLAEAIAPLSNRPPIALLTHEGHRGDATRCRSLRISAYLPHPVSQQDLADTLHTLANAGVHTPAHATVHTLAHATVHTLAHATVHTLAHATLAGETTTAWHRPDAHLITRHFLRESRRRLRIVMDSSAADVAATLREFGHTVLTVDADTTEAKTAEEKPAAKGTARKGTAKNKTAELQADLVVVDVSGGDDTPFEAVARALTGVGGSPAVLALVDDPASPSLRASAQLGILARKHDPLALREALCRLRAWGDSSERATMSNLLDGPRVWSAVVRRAGGDEALAQTLIATFVHHGPNWMTAVKSQLQSAELPEIWAFIQLRTALEVLDLRAAAELAVQLATARKTAERYALFGDLQQQIHQATARMQAVLERRRYAGHKRA